MSSDLSMLTPREYEVLQYVLSTRLALAAKLKMSPRAGDAIIVGVEPIPPAAVPQVGLRLRTTGNLTAGATRRTGKPCIRLWRRCGPSRSRQPFGFGRWRGGPSSRGEIPAHPSCGSALGAHVQPVPIMAENLQSGASRKASDAARACRGGRAEIQGVGSNVANLLDRRHFSRTDGCRLCLRCRSAVDRTADCTQRQEREKRQRAPFHPPRHGAPPLMCQASALQRSSPLGQTR